MLKNFRSGKNINKKITKIAVSTIQLRRLHTVMLKNFRSGKNVNKKITKIAVSIIKLRRLHTVIFNNGYQVNF